MVGIKASVNVAYSQSAFICFEIILSEVDLPKLIKLDMKNVVFKKVVGTFKSLKKPFASAFPSKWGTVISPCKLEAFPFKQGLVSAKVDHIQC